MRTICHQVLFFFDPFVFFMNHNNSFYIVVGLIVFFIIVSVFYIKQQSIPEDAAYVGSKRCVSCHINEHQDWSNSYHAKMMRKVSEPGVLVADFKVKDIMFDPEHAVWAIGSKWEQQFMGVENGREVLLPGAWLNSTQKWKTQGWDGWTVPDPVKRCHGCHTVGLNVETGHFVEASVGCESCHGPGEWHSNTMGIGKIAVGVDAQICGQCHSRGHSKEGGLFFPYGYRPGDQLDLFFDEIKPYATQNSSHWWKNGHPRKRHQEYPAWNQSGHVNSLKSLKENYSGQYGKVTSKCLSCHAGEAINDGMSESYKLDEVQYGITCAVCHNTHGDLTKPRLGCTSCHGTNALHHQAPKSKKHVICKAQAKVKCEQCHMPLTVKNGGGYTLHSHRAGIIPPSETRKSGVPNSCANGGCHDNSDVDWLESKYQNYYLSSE